MIFLGFNETSVAWSCLSWSIPPMALVIERNSKVQSSTSSISMPASGSKNPCADFFHYKFETSIWIDKNFMLATAYCIYQNRYLFLVLTLAYEKSFGHKVFEMYQSLWNWFPHALKRCLKCRLPGLTFARLQCIDQRLKELGACLLPLYVSYKQMNKYFIHKANSSSEIYNLIRWNGWLRRLDGENLAGRLQALQWASFILQQLGNLVLDQNRHWEFLGCEPCICRKFDSRWLQVIESGKGSDGRRRLRNMASQARRLINNDICRHLCKTEQNLFFLCDYECFLKHKRAADMTDSGSLASDAETGQCDDVKPLDLQKSGSVTNFNHNSFPHWLSIFWLSCE